MRGPQPTRREERERGREAPPSLPNRRRRFRGSQRRDGAHRHAHAHVHKHKHGVCWTTALIVCVATLNSIQTIEYGESFVFRTTTLAGTHRDPEPASKQRRCHGETPRSVPLAACGALGAARRGEDPWSLSSSTTKQRRETHRGKKLGGHQSVSGAKGETKPLAPTRSAQSVASIADASYQLLDHELLTKDEEYELGLKIRKFIDTKAQIEEMMKKKKEEYERRQEENQRRREKAAEDRRRRRTEKRTRMEDTMEELEDDDDENNDDLSMEEELEEYLVTKGLVSGNKFDRKRSDSRLTRHRSSIEELYGVYDDDDDDEETMMEELGMAIYGIENIDDDGLSDGLTVVESRNEFDFDGSNGNNYNHNNYDDEDDYGFGEEDEFDSLAETSASSQLGDVMDSIRMLTEADIVDELGIEGGREELSKILIDGALAKQQMIKSNVRLVTSIAKKWMRTSASSVHKNRNADNEKNRKGSNNLGDWSTPSLDEVVQQGIVGLAIAAERFEPERKFKFSTYATYYITNEIRQIMQSATTQCLYVPPYFYTIKNKYEKIVRDNYRETAGDPARSLGMDEIAALLKLKRTRLEFILKSTQTLAQLDASLDTSNYNAGKAGSGPDSEKVETLADILPADDPSPEEIVERSLLRQCLENALAAELLPLERDIVRLRHGLDDGKSRTHKEVMGSFGGLLTLNDIRTAETRAYRKLRFKSSVHNARLREFAAEFIGVAPEKLKTV